MTETTYTREETDAAVRRWADGACDAAVCADVILNSTARVYVEPYLQWSSDGQFARPDLAGLLRDFEEDRVSLSGSGEMLVRFAANVIGQGSVDLRDLWKLDPSNRRVLLTALDRGFSLTRTV